MSSILAARVRPGRAGVMALARLLVAGVVLAFMAPVHAQLAPRLTAQVAMDELGKADAALAPVAGSAGAKPLLSVQQQLKSMAAALQAAASGDAAKPVEMVGDALRGQIVRAHAAASRVQAFLKASAGCRGSDAAAMQMALSEGISRLSSATDSAKLVPVIDAVETMKQAPLFAIQRGAGPLSFALVGAHLADSQCADPTVRATDMAGHALPTQPVLTGAVPGRIELRWAEAGSLAEGSVVLHVTAQHKVFLLGCKALPEATAVLRVTPQVRFDVSYTLEAVCPGAQNRLVKLGQGSLPPVVGQGKTVSLPVDTSACADPQSYRLNAVVTGSDGRQQSAGPFTQSAEASMTVGLPGGLSLSWKPDAKMLFVRSGLAVCKGVH